MPMTPSTSLPRRSRWLAPIDRTKLRDALYKVKYDGIIAKYDPAFEQTAERHDAILPAHYKLLAYHKGVLTTDRSDAYALK